MPKKQVSRRHFIQTTTAGASLLAIGAPSRVLGANDKIALGIIGTGGRGQRLLKGITNIDAYQMVSVCDLRSERVDQAADICGGEVKKYSDMAKMLDSEKLDACIVATEVGNHAKTVIPVLESGIHCFSEKPMDCSVEAVDAITKVARKAKGIYQVGFQRRYAPGFQASVKAVHDGAIGKITMLQGQWQWTWSVGGWVLNVDMSGGELVEQACHHMDVMQWVMKGQHPTQCFAIGATTQPHTEKFDHYSEDRSAVLFEFPGNIGLSYTHVFYCPHEFVGEKLWVYGETGGIDLSKSEKYTRPKNDDDHPAPVKLGEVAPDWDYGTYEELEGFARHIKNGEQPLSNVETARVSTLISLMGRKAMYDRNTKKFEPKVVKWEDLGTTTDQA